MRRGCQQLSPWSNIKLSTEGCMKLERASETGAHHAVSSCGRRQEFMELLASGYWYWEVAYAAAADSAAVGGRRD